MITLDDLIKIKPKRITYKDTHYYVSFVKVNKKDDLGNYKNYYFAVLYKESPLYNPMVFVFQSETYEEADILQNYIMKYMADLGKLIKELKENNKDIEHSHTYIHDIITCFFRKYIKHKEIKEKPITEKNEQLKNFEKWDGVINEE